MFHHQRFKLLICFRSAWSANVFDMTFSFPDQTLLIFYWSQNSSNFSGGSLFRSSKCWFTCCKRKSSHVKYKTASGCFFCLHQYFSIFTFRNIYHSETAQLLLVIIILWSFTTPETLPNIQKFSLGISLSSENKISQMPFALVWFLQSAFPTTGFRYCPMCDF